MTRTRLTLAGISLLVGVTFITGCENYSGSSGGRLDTTATSRAESADPRILPAALIEFSDQAAVNIVQNFITLPEIKDSPERVTIVFGDIRNRTGIVSSEDFEMVRSRIRNSLLQSKYVGKHLRFVESRARMEQLRSREFDTPGNTAPQPTLDVTNSYIFNGDVYRIDRGSMNLYYMEFQFVSAADYTIVFSDRYDQKQIITRD